MVALLILVVFILATSLLDLPSGLQRIATAVVAIGVVMAMARRSAQREADASDRS